MQLGCSWIGERARLGRSGELPRDPHERPTYTHCLVRLRPPRSGREGGCAPQHFNSIVPAKTASIQGRSGPSFLRTEGTAPPSFPFNSISARQSASPCCLG